MQGSTGVLRAVFCDTSLRLLSTTTVPPQETILVGGLEHFSFFHILGIMIPTDELHHFSEVSAIHMGSSSKNPMLTGTSKASMDSVDSSYFNG